LEEGGRVTTVANSDKIQTLLFSSTLNTVQTSSTSKTTTTTFADVTDKVTPVANESKLQALFGNGSSALVSSSSSSSLSSSSSSSVHKPSNVKMASNHPLNFTPAVPPSAIFALINGGGGNSSLNSNSNSILDSTIGNDGSTMVLPPTASIPNKTASIPNPTASIPNKSQAPLISSQSESLPRPPLRPPLPSSANFQTNLNQSGIMSARMQSSSSTSTSSSVDKNHPNTISDKSILPLPPSLPPQKSKNKSTSITILPSDINSSSGAFATAMAGGDQLASFLKILEMGGGNGGTHTSNASVSSFEKQQRLTSGGGGNNSGGGSSGDDVSGIALAAACEAIGDTMGVQTRNTWQPILLHIHSKRLWRRRTENSIFTAMSFHLANLNVKRGSAQYTALHYACLSLARLASQFVRERGGGESLKDKGKESREGEIRDIQSVTSLALRQASGLVTLLVAAGADVNARILESAGGQTPLHFLCSVGYPKLPDDILPKETASALFFAEECLCRAADAMIFAGVDANVKDVEYSQTPLHLSCRNGHPKLSAVLVAHGAKTDLEDRFMDSPIDCAEDNLRVIHAITKQKELQTKHCAGNGIGGEHTRSSTRTVFDDLVIKSSPMNGSPHLLMHILSFLYEKGPGKEAIVEADALLSQSTVPMNALTSLQYSLLEGPAKRALFVEGKLARDDTESSAWSMAAMLLIPPQKKSSGQVEVSIKRPPLIATRGKRSGSLGSSR
jgi:hypothetical protein